MPKRMDEAVATLLRTIKEVNSKPVEEQTEDEKKQAAAAFGRLVETGEKFIRFWTRKMVLCGKDEGEAKSWVIMWLHEIAMTHNMSNPYFWASAGFCINRKRMHYIEASRKQSDREVVLDVAKDESCQAVPCDRHASRHTSLLASQVNEVVDQVLDAEERELLCWVVDGGTYKDFASMKSISPREVSQRMEAIRNKVKAEVGELT